MGLQSPGPERDSRIPNADRNGRGYVNPCLGHDGHEAHVSRRTGLVMNDVDKVSAQVNGDVIKFESNSTPGGSIGFSASIDDTFQVEYVEWVTACAPTEDSAPGQFEDGNSDRYWIRRPTQGSLVPDLIAEVVADLPAPDILWPTKDPEFGWIYVNVSSDIRVDPVADVRKQRSVSNLVGSATAWVQATPSQVNFAPGEPGKAEIACTYASATAVYNPQRATGCFYKYQNSSAISTAADSAFLARTSLSWAITSSGPLTYNNPLSWRQELIQVAEVQALVIANP